MIKFRGNDRDGGGIIGIGLSTENVKRLLRGQPIQFLMSEYGPELAHLGKMVIIHGRTEEKLSAELASWNEQENPPEADQPGGETPL